MLVKASRICQTSILPGYVWPFVNLLFTTGSSWVAPSLEEGMFEFGQQVAILRNKPYSFTAWGKPPASFVLLLQVSGPLFFPQLLPWTLSYPRAAAGLSKTLICGPCSQASTVAQFLTIFFER